MLEELFPKAVLNRMTWVSNLKGRQIGSSGAAKCCESIYVVAKNPDSSPSLYGYISTLKKLMPSTYKGFDYKVLSDQYGPYVIKNELYNSNSAFNEETRPSLIFDIGWNPVTGEVLTRDLNEALPDGFIRISPHKNNDGLHKFHAFRWSRTKVDAEWQNLHFEQTDADAAKVFTKVRDFDLTTLKDLFTDVSTSTGVQDFSSLFNGVSYFEYAKPINLIQVLIDACTEEEDIVLDFFSGSATTAQAVFNSEIARRRSLRFIMVQLPEVLDAKSRAYKDGFSTICEIGEERIRRAGDKVKVELEASNRQIRLGDEPKQLPDIGFRVFKLDDSGIQKPEPGQLLVDCVKPDRSDLDIVFEMMLKWGLELTLPVEKKGLAGYPCYTVAYGELVCCLAPGLTTDALEAIAEIEPRRVLMLDSILDDSLKLNAVQIFKRVEERTGREVELRTV